MPDVGIHRKGEVDLSKLLKKLKRGLAKNVGAIGCFVGVVRGLSKKGDKVKFLKYEGSDDALKKLKKIATETEKRPNIWRVMIHHVIDELGPGEDAIYVLVAGQNRADVFTALPEIMNRVKREVPIWKKEVTKTREYWAHELQK